MAEIGEIPQSTELPDYKRNWSKIKDQSPRWFLPSDWKDVLDSITTAWRDNGKKISDRVKTFTEALILPNVPKLEVADASEYLANTKKDWDKFAEGVTRIANGEQLKWKEMRELSGSADTANGINGAEDEQAIALLQAISETHKEGRTPEWIRQRIAQHAFDEIVDTGAYRVIDYSVENDTVQGRTTQDDLNDEKVELLDALNHDLWDKKTLEEKTKNYKNLRKIILQGDNNVDEDTADPLASLWKAANGEGVTKKSALHYLQLTEEVYQELESGGAFDVELLEEDEDGS